ncbi:unnamed protein product [Urochloa decumbens]|uniref:Uncharacterized protein n=1 Tax=Urochloa decumbens TaxID=240449 RepID=A0ABC9DSE4_9POAL
MNRKLVACSLVVVFLACSCAAPVCASARPLAAAAAGVGLPRMVLAASAAGLATVSSGMDPGSRRPAPINNRRLLGTRTTWLSPPLPNKTRSTAMPAPPPPII